MVIVMYINAFRTKVRITILILNPRLKPGVSMVLTRLTGVPVNPQIKPH